MKKFVARLTVLLLMLSVLAPIARADIIISELCDPRLNYLTDRYIEIYNSGASTVSLTGWQLVAIANNVDVFTWNLSGNIAPGQALVAGDQTLVVPFTVNFPAEAWSAATTNWNGQVGDGAKLKNGSGTVVESLVVTLAEFKDQTYVRHADITTPSLTFVASQWTGTPVDFPTQATPGVHNQVSGPSITAITTIPAAPALGDPVDVQATVTDALAAVSSVTLNWGTVSGSLTNAITMTNTGGSTYLTSSAIPAQTAGTTVFYTITAVNANTGQTVSGVQNFGVPNTVTIAAIQGTGVTSPLAGQTAVTTGVATGVFGTTFVIQDGTGARSGLWVTGAAAAPAVGSLVQVTGVVAEVSSNTTLTSATFTFLGSGFGTAPEVLSTSAALAEDYEGVLVQLVDVACTLSAASTPRWEVDSGAGAIAVDDLGVSPNLVMGSHYTITGPVSGSTVDDGIVPRSAGDVVFVSDTYVPTITSVLPAGLTSVKVTFSEPVAAASANVAANYTVTGCSVTGAAIVAGQPETVALTVTTMASGAHTLTVNGVADAYGNAISNAQLVFNYYGGNIPVGYYNPAESLIGDPLRLALHNIIDGHSSISYTGLWTAFYTTDDKPNGKVWDMYSDVPGGIPPYEYTFGVDQGGSAGTEGTGYNREHSWPASWFNSLAPMYTDLFQLYPTDNDVNNRRSNYPFGEVTSPTWTTLNGCKVGPNAYPGYTGTVFEPIDAYKGDFARTYFYVTTRYYTEDSAWSSSPAATRCELAAWTKALLLEWNAQDPVSQKEIDRNEAIYAIQGNRNPYIDRPDFVTKVFQPDLLSPAPLPGANAVIELLQNVPNPFNPSTVIRYELNVAGPVELSIYDLAGRLVDTVFTGEETQGRHEHTWQGRDEAGRPVATGVYVYRLRAGDVSETKRMTLAK
jgi:endonuclease I